MNYKIMLAQVEPPWEEGDEGSLKITDCSVEEIWENSGQMYELREDLYRLLNKLIESDDDRVVQMLQGQGWVNMKQVEDREQKLALEKKFLVVARNSFGGTQAQPIDPSRLSSSAATAIANGAEVVQVVKKSTLKELMSKESLATYNRQLKRFKDNQEKRRLISEKRAEKKRQKEIEKAKKILEKAGAKE